MRAAALLALLLVCGPAGVRADEAAAMNRVSLSVEATREVANDTIRASVGVTEEGTDPAELAGRVNEAVRWGLQVARGVPAVSVESGAYGTRPVYEDGQIRRWRASQDLTLESREVDEVAQLLGKLQERLVVRQVEFLVSTERRRAVEDELIQEALAAFRARADLVRASLERRGFALVQLQVSTQGRAARPQQVARALQQADAAAPALVSGESTLTVSVSGTIELE